MAEIRGMKELKEAFKNLNIQFGKNADTAVVLGGLSYIADVKKICPYKTGTLRRSIHVQPPEHKGGVVVAYAGTDLKYARRLEYGFADKDSRGRVYNQAARPYFRPPLDTNREKYINVIRKAMFR